MWDPSILPKEFLEFRSSFLNSYFLVLFLLLLCVCVCVPANTPSFFLTSQFSCSRYTSSFPYSFYNIRKIHKPMEFLCLLQKAAPIFSACVELKFNQQIFQKRKKIKEKQMMEAKTKSCHKVQVFACWVNTVRFLALGTLLPWPIEEAKLLDTGECNSSSCNCVLRTY